MNIPCLKVHLVRWATDFWLNFYTREGTPMFEMFDPIGSLFYAPTWSDCPPLSAGKISLSLSHLVPEILGPKFGLMFHQMYYLTLFKHFVSSFSLIFYPFCFLILDLFYPSFLQNLTSDWVTFFISCCIWLPKIWWSTPTLGDFYLQTITFLLKYPGMYVIIRSYGHGHYNSFSEVDKNCDKDRSTSEWCCPVTYSIGCLFNGERYVKT